MALNRSLALAVLLLFIGGSWGSVFLSDNNIECNKPWQSAIVITKQNGEPYPNCRVYVSVMETRGGIETTTSQYSYFTDSKGTAILSYTAKTFGEKLRISVSCGENKYESKLSVAGLCENQNVPSINLEFPSIETWQYAVVAFILFALVFIVKGPSIMGSFKKATSKKTEATKHDIEEMEMSPRRLLLEHERKMAAKLAKKHKRKEIRLGHEYIRKLE
jgi:hypothetical protein